MNRSKSDLSQQGPFRRCKYGPHTSPVSEYFLDVHPSKWAIGESLELLRDGPDPSIVVYMLREVEDGRRDPTDPRLDDLFEILIDYFNAPRDLRAQQNDWYRRKWGMR